MLEAPAGGQSFFVFGPRGAGKTTWLKQRFPEALYLDLLDHALYLELLARPERLRELIPPRHDGWIVLDEVQRVPLVLNEVHRLIEADGRRFLLIGSSARSLRRRGVNLLGGRARILRMYPLTAAEAGADFSLERALSAASSRPSIASRIRSATWRRTSRATCGRRSSRRGAPATWPPSAVSSRAPAFRRPRRSTWRRSPARSGWTARRPPATSISSKTC